MDFKPNPQQHLFLWCLATEPGRSVSKLSYKALKPPLRKQLETTGLIEISRQGRNKIPALTEQGWFALEQNLGEPLSPRASANAKVLQAVLAGLAGQIHQGKIALSEVIVESAPVTARPEKPKESFSDSQIAPNDVKRRLYDACRCIAGDGVYNVRIRLADLRAQLADVPRPAVDEALKDLERNEGAALWPLDDPREIKAEDEAAALPNASGAKRHILYLSRPR